MGIIIIVLKGIDVAANQTALLGCRKKILWKFPKADKLLRQRDIDLPT